MSVIESDFITDIAQTNTGHRNEDGFSPLEPNSSQGEINPDTLYPVDRDHLIDNYETTDDRSVALREMGRLSTQDSVYSTNERVISPDVDTTSLVSERFEPEDPGPFEAEVIDPLTDAYLNSSSRYQKIQRVAVNTARYIDSLRRGDMKFDVGRYEVIECGRSAWVNSLRGPSLSAYRGEEPVNEYFVETYDDGTIRRVGVSSLDMHSIKQSMHNPRSMTIDFSGEYPRIDYRQYGVDMELSYVKIEDHRSSDNAGDISGQMRLDAFAEESLGDTDRLEAFLGIKNNTR
ncbi:hypothetical protein CR956_00905 [Candidatus Saccharibacteria bacterium]|nr:MAG: hypothetical protein CR956_00905 [Candidatus Saccharibacteria bacterium]